MEETQLGTYALGAKDETRNLSQLIDSITSLISDGATAKEIRNAAELTYSKALEVALLANRMMLDAEMNSFYDVPISANNFDMDAWVYPSSPFPIGIEINSTNTIIRMAFQTPPILKSRAASGNFYELFCLDLERKMVERIPADFQKFSSAYVIFVSHYDEGQPKNKQPYFDNDNLAIKGILDATIPNICVDDASKYCDNIYLSHPDTATFCELFVVKKDAIREWLTENSHLSFSKNCMQTPW